MSAIPTSDQFTSFMVELFDEREVQSSPQAFQSLFGKTGGPDRTVFSEDTATVQIDILRANGERLAATVNRGQSSSTATNQKNSTDQNFTNVNREYPLIEEVSNINSTQLIQRLAGDNTFEQNRSRLDRNRVLARDLHFDQIRKSVRTMEFFARESILTGKHPAIIGTNNNDLIYDFQRKGTHLVTVGTGWNQAAAEILANLDDACELIEQDSFMSPNFAGIGDDAMDALINDDKVQLVSDNRRFELIMVSTNNPVPPEFSAQVAAGWIPRGRLRTPKGRVLWMFNNNQNFTNAAGSTVRYMPSDQAFVMDTRARMDRYFGPADSLPLTPDQMIWHNALFGFNMGSAPIPVNVSKGGIINPAMFHFDAFRSVDNKTVSLRTQSAPIYPTTQTDAIVTLKGLIT